MSPAHPLRASGVSQAGAGPAVGAPARWRRNDDRRRGTALQVGRALPDPQRWLRAPPLASEAQESGTW